MADFDICNVYKRRPTKRKGDKKSKEKKVSSYQTFLNTRAKFGVDGTRSDTDESDSDDYSTSRTKKKQKLMYGELNKLRTCEEAPMEQVPANEEDEEEEEDAAAALSTNDMSSSTEPSAEPEMLVDDKPIELSDDEDIQYPLPPRKEAPRWQPPPPVVPSIEDMTDLDPDLLKIVTAAPASDASSAQATNAPVEKVCIKVQFVSLKKTDDPATLRIIARLEEAVKVYLMENDPFEKLLQWYCQKKIFKKSDILLVYDGTPVMPRATPSSLHMVTGKKKNLIKAYLKADYQKQQEEESEMIDRRLHESPFDENFVKSLETEVEAIEEGMRIKLRGKNNDDFNIRVKKTTSLRAIVKRYVEVKELGDATIDKIRLSFDGEDLSLDTTVADTDLEDEDVVTVIVS